MATYEDAVKVAERNGLELVCYGTCKDTQKHNIDSFLTYALFTNENNPSREKDIGIEIRYEMNRVGNRDSWITGKIHSLSFWGIARDNTKPFGGIFNEC